MERDLTWEPAQPLDADELAAALGTVIPGLVDRSAPMPTAGELPEELRDRLALAQPNRILEWIDDEGRMHVVTALSGGGPAYLFLLIEALAKAGAANGLDQDLAMRLARTTIIGSGALAAADPAPVEDLRRNVTSPGGTTEAALSVLMDRGSGLQPLFEAAIAAGVRRSRELG